MTMKDNDKSFFDVLSSVIDEAFSNAFDETKEDSVPSSKYSSIEEYSVATGKRFRMTKDQMERGLTREEAFTELYINEEN